MGVPLRGHQERGKFTRKIKGKEDKRNRVKVMVFIWGGKLVGKNGMSKKVVEGIW